MSYLSTIEYTSTSCLFYLFFILFWPCYFYLFFFLNKAQPIPPELTAKLLGNRVAVSPIVTVEPRRRKFHKPITLTIPVPTAAGKGMINSYSGETPTLRLLCSITGTYTLFSISPPPPLSLSHHNSPVYDECQTQSAWVENRFAIPMILHNVCLRI